MNKNKDTKIVIVNHNSDINHDILSYDGIKVSIPNKDGTVGEYMTKKNAKKVSRKSKKSK